MTPERHPPVRRQFAEVDREDPSKTRGVNDENMGTTDDTCDMSLDSLKTEALQFHTIDQLIIGKALQGSDVLELNPPVRVNAVAAKFGLVPDMSLDLINGYNFNEKQDQDKAWEGIRRAKPTLVIGSPPCSYFLFFKS